jgi:methionyl-tRNA synthetase
MAMDEFSFNKGMMIVWEFINVLNKYIDMTAPWVLAKKKSSQKQLEAVIYNLLEGLRIISGLIYPVMPETAKKMQQHLGLDPALPFYVIERLKVWRLTEAGTQLPKSIVLFPRIDNKKGTPVAVSDQEEMPPALKLKPEITLEDFAKVDLRVATVVKAEVVPRAKKLLQLEVDMGTIRTIVSGIAPHYTPETLIGKQVIVVANLKPAKLMGILSEGMLLAAVDETGPTIATLDKTVKPGTRLS